MTLRTLSFTPFFLLMTSIMVMGQNQGIDILDNKIRNTPAGYGIIGQEAPELQVTPVSYTHLTLPTILLV